LEEQSKKQMWRSLNEVWYLRTRDRKSVV
jgi:hypothetical protein